MNEFWKGKRVLITGHTGFKGSWLALWLQQLGAHVTGLSLAPETPFFDTLDLGECLDHHVGDIRDIETVRGIVAQCDPQIVFHMAAQSLVLRSYSLPLETWGTNVTGSLHLMEAMRTLSGPRAVVMVTTDKVYANDEQSRAFSEEDQLGGHDPYSASKAAMEIAIDSWRKSFLSKTDVRMASARAGNVIGGGDWAENRIVPDIARALAAGAAIEVRSPDAIRPWQHVLEPLRGYMNLAEQLYTSDDTTFQGAFNFGPADDGVRSVRDVVETALAAWPGKWKDTSGGTVPHEAGVLTLSTQKAQRVLGHVGKWTFEQSVQASMSWYRAVAEGGDVRQITLQQLKAYDSLCS
ncbi:MAG: CDP-glucose 4,6-dehydratase [Roseobacter sp.]